MLAATPIRPSSVLRLPFSPRARTQIGLFLFAYLVYSAARFVTIGDLSSAKDHADWIVGLKQSTGTAVEASVQQAFDGTWMLYILNHLYLIAQLGVIPAALIFLYRRSYQLYETLRNTILATWLISVPVYGLFPVAPPRLADIGITDTIATENHLRDARTSRRASTTRPPRCRACTSASPSPSASPCTPRCATRR